MPLSAEIETLSVKSDFTPGDNGFTAAYMAGGPLDGKAYGEMPVMPDGKPGDGLSIPHVDAR